MHKSTSTSDPQKLDNFYEFNPLFPSAWSLYVYIHRDALRQRGSTGGQMQKIPAAE